MLARTAPRRRGRPVRYPATHPSGRGRGALSFLKWAGSKAAVLDELLPLMPREFGTYYEPMVGSGTVCLTLQPEWIILGDINAELMNCYEVIRDHLPGLLRALRRHVNTKEHFLEVRAQAPAALSTVERAARTIYLNKTCYNGLYRVNASGKFNVPWGGIGWANFTDEPTLARVSALIRYATLRRCDFAECVRDAGPGDLVYLDPPYLQRSRGDLIFNAYQPGAFGLADHRRLAETFRDLDRRGCHVVLSNSNVPQIRELYEGYAIAVIRTRRNVNRDASRRAGWEEVVVHNIRSSAPA